MLVADQLRPGAAAAVARLSGLGLRTVLLTGDNERAALAAADHLRIPAPDVYAGIQPDGKTAIIRQLRADGYPVAREPTVSGGATPLGPAGAGR